MSLHTTKWVTGWVVVVLALAGAAGCGAAGNHAKAMNAANDRWVSARTKLLLQTAQRQFDTGDLDQSAKTLADALIGAPDDARIHLLSGRISLERGLLERAFHQIELASTLDPSLAEPHYFLGIVLQRWQRYDAALQQYRKAYELTPDNPAFLLAAAEMMTQVDRTQDAIDLLQSKLTYFDQNAGIRSALGHLHASRGEHREAAEYFQQACLLRPDDALLMEELATAWMAAGDYDRAITKLEQLCGIAENQSRDDLKRMLASAYRAVNRLADAQVIYVDLRRKNPRDVDAWLELGQISWQQEDLPAALVAANRAMALMPTRAEGYLLAGMVWRKRGRTDEALRLFDRAAELMPGSAEPCILRGMTLQGVGRADAAAQAYSEALRRQPQDARARELLATVTTN